MKCPTCGLAVPLPKAPSNRACAICGVPLKFQSDDFLMYGQGEVRAGQVEMARLVERTIAEKGIALIEGPVGIGKSRGYLFPSLLSGKRVVISTAKKQLQHQIAQKDAPFVASQIGEPITIALLKGKSNYACRLKANSEVPKQDQAFFFNWLDNADTGDLTEFTGRRPHYWWDITAEDCIGTRCQFRDRCGYWKAKQQMKMAHIIVANHHVVAFDLKFGPKKILGEYSTLIIDEAHQAEQAFRGAYGAQITPYGVQKILKQLDKVGITTGLEEKLRLSWKSMFELVADRDGEVPKAPFGVHGDEALITMAEMLDATRKELRDLGAPSEMNEDDEVSGKIDWEAVSKYEMLKKTLERNIEALKKSAEPDDNTVIYLTSTDKGAKICTVAPINVGAMVGPKLKMIDTVVVTSATIQVAGSFDAIRKSLGLPREDPPRMSEIVDPVSMAQAATALATVPKPTHELVLETPFDYNTQALLYTPRHLPIPVILNGDPLARKKYLDAIAMDTFKLIRAADGNAFVLFSATSDLMEVATRLQQEDLKGITLITQGDDAEGALRTFMKTPRAVILGLKSFWEGVDVVGDKLRLVVITKLPFPQLSDPVLQAQARKMRYSFMQKGMAITAIEGLIFRQLQVPIMVTDLRQGAGRLIRSKTDRGVLALLDTRIWSGSSKQGPSDKTTHYQGYGATVVKALGFGQRTSDPRLVEQYLQTIGRRSP